MNIGEFGLKNGRIIGWIATRTIDMAKLGLREVESQNELAPNYEVVAFNGNRWVQVGALWEAVAKKTGEIFLQGNIDDPSMAEPLPIALFGSVEEGYRVAWRRPERRDDFGPAVRTSRDNGNPGNGGEYGFGGSTADENGGLTRESNAAELDDEVAF
ncbi:MULTISPECIES: DUF736 domain-containing protein [Sphingomonadales]|jgi:uncharacterized protein (DUF736 family)|uniref:Uncharacterized protein (DUF736 family) n=2 Tax=Sphingomonadaceae TaxID=41297 RepID=A0A397P8Y3_9SPHN|nr:MULTISPECIES: DUF736 domain-containing protein [Sphingomonadaceae]EKU73352.1 hypothetical protein HMPREF9718_03821 [Sphingobium yanoikuyae ATCC 51230]RIA46020.1 uncharacterized protein (DUF736 family) [Hephaestia caeni]WQE08135.1 DUF736 domain-containing protein [Sphingobium yanoikuyae]